MEFHECKRQSNITYEPLQGKFDFPIIAKVSFFVYLLNCVENWFDQELY